MIYFILVIISFIIFITISNNLNKLIIKIDESISGIDIALTKRYDTLVKMVEVVKGYSKYEKETLSQIIQIRSDLSIEEKQKASYQMNSELKRVNVLVEGYPQLKANENYLYLQKVILDNEENLQAARRIYNSNVSIYNQKIDTFPINIVAAIKKYKKRDFFEADVEKSENITMDFV